MLSSKELFSYLQGVRLVFRPTKAAQLTTPFRIHTPFVENKLGQRVKSFAPVSYNSFGNFSGYGGTEKEVNGVTIIEETFSITCWFDPAITSECRIERLTDNAMFEVMNVENIEMRNQIMIIKVRRIAGKV